MILLLAAATLLLLQQSVAADDNTTTTTTTATTTTTMTTTTTVSNGSESLPTTSVLVNGSMTTAANETMASEPIDITHLPALAWVIFAACLCLVFVLNGVLVRYYTDRQETEWFPFLVTVIALSLAMFAIILIPLDVYLAPTGDGNTSVIKYTYFVLYGLVMLVTLVVVPFAYFYYEEDDEDVTLGRRILGGCKYTSFMIVILIVLVIVGAVLTTDVPVDLFKNDSNSMQTAEKLADWAGNLFAENKGALIPLFGLSCLTLLGFLCVITYTAFGMAAMPVDMMRSRKSKAEEESQVYQTLNVTKEKKRAINAKYISGKKMSKADEKTLTLLSRQERVLSRQGERIEDSQKGWNRVAACCAPFEFAFGGVFFLISIFLFVSLLMTQIGRLSKSLCGAACGYLLDIGEWTKNPLDFVLYQAARVQAFLDLGLFSFVILFLFFVTLSGIVKVGIRILWLVLFRLKRRSSPPQGLLLASMILVLALLAISNMLMSLAPQYTTYGGQMYRNETGVHPCDHTYASNTTCHMSQIGEFTTYVQIAMPFFGVAFYWITWAFLATTLLSFFWSIVRCRKSNITRDGNDSDEAE
jgi:LMBR1 domain-containing protein 1